MVSFVSPLLRAGQIGVATTDEGPPSHETQLTSAVGLRSTNVINQERRTTEEEINYDKYLFLEWNYFLLFKPFKKEIIVK